MHAPQQSKLKQTWDCVVVGGGLAGVSAAVRMADTGKSVLLIEKRPFLGGRASSFRDPRTGVLVDCCQHLTLGCCTAVLGLLNQLGATERILWLDRIHFSLTDGSRATLRASRLPAPYHLAGSLLRFPMLTLADKLSLGRLLRAAIRWSKRGSDATAGDEPTFAAVCSQLRVSLPARSLLIRPLVVSACNADLDEVAASYGLMALYEVLCGSKSGYRIGLPRVPLADLWTEPAVRYLQDRGGQVWLRSTVTDLHSSGTGAVEIRLLSGEILHAKACVVAVPTRVARQILRPDVLTPHQHQAVRTLRLAPIVGAHLWFDRAVDCPEALALLGARTHWVFNVTRIHGATSDHGTHIAAVTSGDRRLAQLPPSDVLSLILADLHRRILDTVDAKLLRWRVIREQHATFVPSPGVDTVRPLHQTHHPNIAIAGDWTATGWPSTMEGAIRSGILASRVLLEQD